MIYRRSKKIVLALADLHQNINNHLQKGFSPDFGKTFRHTNFHLNSIDSLHKKKENKASKQIQTSSTIRILKVD